MRQIRLRLEVFELQVQTLQLLGLAQASQARWAVRQGIELELPDLRRLGEDAQILGIALRMADVEPVELRQLSRVIKRCSSPGLVPSPRPIGLRVCPHNMTTSGPD